MKQASSIAGTDRDLICLILKYLWTHLLGPIELVGVFIEQVEGLRGALPLVHVACDEDPLHAHLQLPGALPPLVVVAVPLLAPFPRVVCRGRHDSSLGFGTNKKPCI